MPKVECFAQVMSNLSTFAQLVPNYVKFCLFMKFSQNYAEPFVFCHGYQFLPYLHQSYEILLMLCPTYEILPSYAKLILLYRIMPIYGILPNLCPCY